MLKLIMFATSMHVHEHSTSVKLNKNATIKILGVNTVIITTLSRQFGIFMPEHTTFSAIQVSGKSVFTQDANTVK
jgi:hypothetical protein